MKIRNKIQLCAVLFLVSGSSVAAIINNTLDTSTLDFSNQTESLFKGISAFAPNVQQVIAAYNSGDVIQAKDLISKILGKNPQNPQALHVAGIMFMQEKRYKNAQVAFEAALRSEVRNPAILSNLGATRVLMGDRAEGRKILNLALKLDPNNQLALRYLAWLTETNKNYRDAAGHYTRLIEIVKPEGLSALHVSQARVLTKARRYSEAIKILSPLISASSGQEQGLNTIATTLLIESYIQTNQFNLASSLLSTPKNNLPLETLQSTVFNIELFIKQHRKEKAQNLIRSSIQKIPENEHVIRYSASQAFAEVGERNLAIEQMKSVVKFLESNRDESKMLSALNDLTALYVSADRKLDALRFLNKYVAKYPENYNLGYLLAELQTSMGQFSDANKTLDKTLVTKASFSKAYYLKGVIARREKKYTDAEKWFSKVNQMNPVYEQAWIQRSASLIDAGKMDEALDVMDSAVQKNKGNALLWFEYGALLTNLNQHYKAIAAYKVVLANFPDHLPSIDNLAGELLVLGSNPQEALHYALKAVQMDPTDKVLQLNYLEALFQNSKYQSLIENAEKVKSGFDDSGRYHYLVGASYLKVGEKIKGKTHLNLAARDTTLENRYSSKLTKLLER